MIKLQTKEPPTGEDVTITVESLNVTIEGGSDIFQAEIMMVAENFAPEGYVPYLDLELIKDLQEYFPGEVSGDLEIESDPDRIY